MKGTIRVKMDYDTGQPVLRLTSSKGSDDLADETLNFFVQKALDGGVLYPTFVKEHNDDNTIVIDIRCEKVESKES